MNEELKQKIRSLRHDYDKLLEAVAMSDVSRELSDTATRIAALPGRVQAIRGAGYAYANYLEHKVDTLNDQWSQVRFQIQRAIRNELANARSEVEPLDELWDELERAIAGGAKTETAKTAGKGMSAMLSAAVGTGSEEETEADSTGGLLSQLKAMSEQTKAAGDLAAAVESAIDASGDSVDDAQAAAIIGQLEGAMARAEKSIEGSKERIQALYGNVPGNVGQTESQLSDIETWLERAKTANFEWNAGEDMYMVVKAEWKKTGNKKEDPDGFLYITSQRLVMEQAEKKGGFMGFGGKRVEELLWESPIGAMEEIDYEKKGLLGGIDLIHIRFGSGGPFGDVTLEVKEGIHARVFASKLQQAASGAIERERGLERSDAEKAFVDAIADLPTTCPVCGATLDQEVTRGMTQLECAYCGAIVRIGATS